MPIVRSYPARVSVPVFASVRINTLLSAAKCRAIVGFTARPVHNQCALRPFSSPRQEMQVSLLMLEVRAATDDRKKPSEQFLIDDKTQPLCNINLFPTRRFSHSAARVCSTSTSITIGWREPMWDMISPALPFVRLLIHPGPPDLSPPPEP